MIYLLYLTLFLRPNLHDYQEAQQKLSHQERPELMAMEEALVPGGILYDYRHRVRRLRLLGKRVWERPFYEKSALGREEKQCVISYASYNQRFPRGIPLLRESLEKHGFQGHFLSRIGGFPYGEEGLAMAHIPYAFKLAFFLEAKEAGYEQILWLDSSVRVQGDLAPIFQQIKEKGYFFLPASHTLEKYCNTQVFDYFGLDPSLAEKIDSVAAGLFGLDVTHPTGKAILDAFHAAALKETPFYSPRADQNVLSVLRYLHQADPFDPHLLSMESGVGLFFLDYKSIQ